MNEQVAETDHGELRCPRCGAFDAFAKASAIYEAQTARVDGRTRSNGVGLGIAAVRDGFVPALVLGGASGTIASVQQTDLARRLAPPSPPRGLRPVPGQKVARDSRAVTVGILGGAGLGGLVGSVFAMGLMASLAEAWSLNVLVVGLGLLALAAFTGCGAVAGWWVVDLVAQQSRPALVAAWARWDNDIYWWQRLWYCFRCGEAAYV